MARPVHILIADHHYKEVADATAANCVAYWATENSYFVIQRLVAVVCELDCNIAADVKGFFVHNLLNSQFSLRCHYPEPKDRHYARTDLQCIVSRYRDYRHTQT